jgi:uncharacterized damage-inducible protein DinB
MMRDFMLNYLRFNLWANEQYIIWLNTLPAEAIPEKVPSSFPSILETFMHIWDAQHVWSERLRGEAGAYFPSHEFVGEWPDVCAHVRASSEALLAYCEAQSSEWFEQKGDYKLMNGMVGRSTRADMILHCVQHSTYHRGQIVTIYHVLHMKEPVPRTDFIYYTRLQTAQ